MQAWLESGNDVGEQQGDGDHDWREVDRTLRGLAKQRATLDAEEARWLRVADRLRIWRHVGCVSLLEYMEQHLGYGPRAAQERLRVAFALDKLPALAESLASGEMPFTAVRELTRVATPETEATWLDAGRDRNVHEIEALVSGHRPGDLPTDAPDPELVMKTLRYQVRPATYALMRQAKAALEKSRGERLDDDALIAALCTSALETCLAAPASGAARREAAYAEPSAHVDADAVLTANADAHVAAIADPRVRANTDPRVRANTDPRVRANTDPRVDATVRANADPRVGAIAEATVRANADPRVDAIAEATVRASADPRADATAEIRVGASASADAKANANAHSRVEAAADEDAGRTADEATVCPSPATGRDPALAKYQIAVILCDACKRGWQEGGGVREPMTAADVERAMCDAQHLGAVDAARPARATQDVPPSVRRLIRRRDGGKCSLPQCRSTRNLELHHIVARENGGSHAPVNIVQLCDGHHAALHRGMLSIAGEAPDRLVISRRHESRAHVDAKASKLDRVTQRVQARRALVELGFKGSEAAAAIDAAYVHVGADVSLELLLREALRRCPKRTSS